MEFIQLIKYSPKHQVTFGKHSETAHFHFGYQNTMFNKVDSSYRYLQAIVTNYEALSETMEVASQGTDECAR